MPAIDDLRRWAENKRKSEREREKEEGNTGFLEEESGLGIHLKNSVTGSQ